MASTPKRRKCVCDEELKKMKEQADKIFLTEQRLELAELAEKLQEQSKTEFQQATISNGYAYGPPHFKYFEPNKMEFQQATKAWIRMDGEQQLSLIYATDDGIIRPPIPPPIPIDAVADNKRYVVASFEQKKEPEDVYTSPDLCTIS
ncbi:Hypothetical predicted protein [Paramuricea clavata]|uniref:Uncharacterized protein n=1 Tax=Paramuricea clavata TaxID=317549 RepID=A0A7D9DAZ4_PARCT|nr:Hypothetical predicted protein [Paramuricea clavata]